MCVQSSITEVCGTDVLLADTDRWCHFNASVTHHSILMSMTINVLVNGSNGSSALLTYLIFAHESSIEPVKASVDVLLEIRLDMLHTILDVITHDLYQAKRSCKDHGQNINSYSEVVQTEARPMASDV